MNKVKVIGLTGGIGSGKTRVLQLFEDKGLPIYMADLEAKKLMQNDKRLRAKIIKTFGIEAYLNNQLNRAFLAAQVFKNPAKLKKLNAIVHPAVRKHFKDYLSTCEKPFVVFENAILFETGFDEFCDYTITITAPLDLKIERIISRDGMTKSQILERMKNQWDDKEKIKKTDFVIENVAWENTVKAFEEIYLQIVP